MINVEDAAFEHVLGVLRICQGVKVISTENLQGIVSGIDECSPASI